jgi:membrane fusion protein (multidrug efflux system)
MKQTIRCVLLMLVVTLSLAPVIEAQEEAPAVPVRYTEARQASLRRSLDLTGSVESRRSSMVASEVEGLVEKLAAREGDRVDKGEPLVELRRQNIALRHEAMQGQLKEAEARQQLALTSLDRSQGLFEESIISQQQLDDAASEYEAWQGRVAQLKADVARLEDDLVRAPYAGVVVEEHVAEGEWLQEGGEVVEMVDFRDLEVTVEAPESYFAGLSTGDKAKVEIRAIPGFEVEGEIRAVVPRADARARTFPVKVAIPNPEGRIGVGMLARVKLPVGELQEAIVVPKDAVVSQGPERIVFRIGEGEVLERLSVETGTSQGVWVAVTGGIEAGDRVVTRGNERVFPGMTVNAELLEYESP